MDGCELPCSLLVVAHLVEEVCFHNDVDGGVEELYEHGVQDGVQVVGDEDFGVAWCGGVVACARVCGVRGVGVSREVHVSGGMEETSVRIQMERADGHSSER